MWDESSHVRNQNNERGRLLEKALSSYHPDSRDCVRCLEDLMDDPIFLDTIHGDQELALDQALELIDGIKYNFEPEFILPHVADTDRFGNADVS